MTDTLYLRLPSPDPSAIVEGLRVAGDGSVVGSCQRATLAEFAAAAGPRVVVLIPGDEALSITVRLPKMPVAKIARALPFALEDQIAGDLEAQHFAAGKPRTHPADGADGGGIEVPVVVMRRERLNEWLACLRLQGIEPAGLHLEDDCVGAKPGDLRLWLRRDEASLRMPGGEALVVSAGDLSAALSLLPADPPPAVLGLQAIATSADRARNTAAIEQIADRFARLVWLDLGDSPLPWLVEQSSLTRPVNLLQGEFAPRRSRGTAQRRWLLAAALAVALFGVHLLDRVLQLRQDAATAVALAQQVLQAVQAARPEVSSIEDAERLLGSTASGAARNSAIPLLIDALADLAAAGLGSDSLQGVTLEAGAQGGPMLRIALAGPPPDAAIDAAMQRSGWTIQRETAADGRGVLQLSPAARRVIPSGVNPSGVTP